MIRKGVDRRLPEPTREYSQEYMQNLVRSLNFLFNNLLTPGDMVAAKATLLSCPEEDSGLNQLIPGSVWVDAEGHLRLVREGEAFAISTGMAIHVGTVTVTT